MVLGIQSFGNYGIQAPCYACEHNAILKGSIIMRIKRTLVFGLIAAALLAMYAADAKPKQMTWTFDRLDKIHFRSTGVAEVSQFRS
jgi:hypothetical protein